VFVVCYIFEYKYDEVTNSQDQSIMFQKSRKGSKGGLLKMPFVYGRGELYGSILCTDTGFKLPEATVGLALN